MSQRLLLRAACVRALMGATIAERRVFDTLIGPIKEDQPDSYLPLAVIYTDDDDRQNLQTGSASPLYDRTIDVIIELSVGSWMDVEIPAPQGNPELARVLGVVETDPELEALMDLFELQVFRRLGAPEDAVAPWQRMVKGIRAWTSRPGRTKDTNRKTSQRQLVMRCAVADDFSGNCRGVLQKMEVTAPHLATFFDTIAATPALASLRDMLADLYGTRPMPPVDQLLRFGFKVDEVDPDVDRSLLPDGQTQGPDGRIELEAEVSIPPEG